VAGWSGFHGPKAKLGLLACPRSLKCIVSESQSSLLVPEPHWLGIAADDDARRQRHASAIERFRNPAADDGAENERRNESREAHANLPSYTGGRRSFC
jgi:hypothetical protein